jgi:hypothetical protein
VGIKNRKKRALGGDSENADFVREDKTMYVGARLIAPLFGMV